MLERSSGFWQVKRMTIEMKSNLTMILVVIEGFVMFFAAISIAAISSVVVGLLIGVLGAVMVRNQSLIYSRSLEFDETGCTIWSRNGQLHIRWEDMAVKRIEPQHFGMNTGYVWGGAFFSLCPTKKSPNRDPASYAMWHPSTCFWVYFKPKSQEGIAFTHGIYEVDKEEFIGKLKEWNVEYEHIRY